MSFTYSIKQAGRTVTPRRLRDYYRFVRLARQARGLNRSARFAAEPVAYSDLLWQSPDFRPIQKQSEITKLVEVIKTLCPETVCEIGAAGGGTLFLLTRAAAPKAMLITLDVHFDPSRKAALRFFARGRQKIVCVEADSHCPETVRTVKTFLAGRTLDLLFIDGDHAYEGVAADFRLYSPLVRPGGLIIFHDIVPDYRTRYGLETLADAGGVAQFWREIKSSQPSVEEIIEDPGQDGFGIGVLRWDGPASMKI